jgi:hypothetical protein
VIPDGDGDPQAGRKVIDFPVSAEEKARRLRAEVERLSLLSPLERTFYIETDAAKYAEKYDIDKATLKRMVEAVVKEAEKKQRDEQAERRRC